MRKRNAPNNKKIRICVYTEIINLRPMFFLIIYLEKHLVDGDSNSFRK